MIRRRQFMWGSLLAAVAPHSHALLPADPVIATRAGPVRGRVIDGIQVFTGIPFAKPPVGELRFAAPRPAEAWSGVLDASRPAATPPQNIDPAIPPVAPISEDCLQVSVWAPARAGPHPVLVWVFGGGNQTGASNQPVYQGDTFARDGVVFVSLNYRVGVLGYLELGRILGPEASGSGNNALRDQLLALEWVRDNIAAFGGDPRNVTIAGQSAGAWGVATLMALPAADGLFHRAIVASGNAAGTYSLERAADFAELFVKHLGGASPADQWANRLRTAPVSELLSAQQLAQGEFPDLVPFRPVVDGSFLPATPIECFRAGVARQVATLLGHTHDEYRYFRSAAQLGGPLQRNMLATMDPQALAPIVSAYRAAFPLLTEGERQLKILGAEVFTIPALRIAEALSAHGGTAYFYNIHYPIANGPFGLASPHGMDVPLIFDKLDTSFATKVFGYTPQDAPMAKRVHDVWVSFIKHGTPRIPQLSWPAYEPRHRATMVLANPPSVVDDTDGVERRIWQGLL